MAIVKCVKCKKEMDEEEGGFIYGYFICNECAGELNGLIKSLPHKKKRQVYEEWLHNEL